ncbi:hypothetical protein M441DRAFT_56891 [Trichoderma asperellum CBS 433.97]|uniref:Uncharacterized protein n=1 Tax=Trichoderma asperellum (strain ATCC 204424 / CBS 433.97 / NBRC 101777) TaxID=1042311 RepID=A0A2T3ZBD1_TRIA4|nr:hypothetical protein M441DRAFT_56891 [Trichoderma asperellum CBS 433.97]PTB42092.1 hypothetical protein M441DRAFT_56891 [Trichoderma asperellum CBS 433.97]
MPFKKTNQLRSSNISADAPPPRRLPLWSDRGMQLSRFSLIQDENPISPGRKCRLALPPSYES